MCHLKKQNKIKIIIPYSSKKKKKEENIKIKAN